MRGIRLLLAAALAAVVPLAAADPPPKEGPAPAAPDKVVEGPAGAALDAKVVEAGGADFWGSVLVAKGGKALLAKGYGMADLDKVPATARSLYDLGAASKTFTAAAVLALVAQKKAALDDPISKHLADVPKDKAAVTVRHLLHHTSGIPYPKDFDEMDFSDREKTVAHYLASPLAAEPGADFDDTTIDDALLAAIVERASGTTFEAYLREQVFRPAGLRSTGFVTGEGLDKALDTARVGHFGDQVIRSTALDFPWTWAQRGATGVVTSALDLLAWDRALRGDKVLDAKARDALYEAGPGDYGCGWFVEKTPRGTTRAHRGGTAGGYHTEVSRFLEEDVVVAVLTNEEGDAAAVAQALAAAVFSK